LYRWSGTRIDPGTGSSSSVTGAGNPRRRALAAVGAGLLDEPVLNAIGTERGLSPAEVVIAWNASQGVVPIPSSTAESHVVSNLAAGSERLTADEVARIDALRDPNFER